MSRARTMTGPRSLMLPFQLAWVRDAARFKIGCWPRQTGKSWTSAEEAVNDCLQHKTTWVCLSAGERQALEWALKAREHAEAYRVSLAGYTEERDSSEAILKAAEIRWPNGSRILAIPANPATARGYAANLVLDEFAFHEDPDAIWRAIYPSISNSLKGVYRIRVLSTPNGLGNKFADIWHKGEQWSKHSLTIHEAVAQGLPLDVDEIRRGLDDPEGWAQEYECQFLDAAAVLLPYDLLATCESDQATTAAPTGFYDRNAAPPLYIGWDFARKRDLSVVWVGELVGDVLWTREVNEMRGMSTPDQVDAMRPRLRLARRVAIDYTGSGVGLGDLLVKEFGQWDPAKHRFGKIELVTFTQPEKVRLFAPLRVAFEKLLLRIPSNRTIREDLHSMQRITTPGGSVGYSAPHTDGSHADRCTALALCVRARGTGHSGAITTTAGIRSGSNFARGARTRPPHIPRRLA